MIGARGRMAPVAFIVVLAAAAGIAQDAPDAAGATALRIVSPSTGDMPVGSVRIEVAVTNTQPGDAVDVFVDGRKVGSIAKPPWEVIWTAGDQLRQHVVSAVLIRAGREAAAARVRTRDPGFVSSATVQAVTLAPIVTDRSGAYILGLTDKDFTVLDDGALQKIDTFESTDSPLAAILVLDISGSMRSKLEDATRAAHAFVAALKPEDELGLYTFNTSVVGKVDLTRDRAAVNAAIDAAQPDGETALYDVIAAALRRLQPLKRRKAVIVFTDGEDNRSRMSVDQVVAMARASDVSIYSVAQGEDESKTLTVFLDRLAAETGGRSFFIGHIRKLAETFGTIVTELRSQYFMTYVPNAASRPHSWHQVEVRVARAGALVRAKKEYFLE